MTRWSRARRRGWWKGPLLAGAAIAAATAGSHGGSSSGGGPGGGPDALSARVTEVIDGDTIAVRLNGGREERVRYIGVDTPESVPSGPLECFGRRAAAANEGMVAGRIVRLRLGPERRDDYARLLAFVFAPSQGGREVFVNAELVRRGYARTLTIAPNDERAPLLERLERAAGRAGIGLWGVC